MIKCSALTLMNHQINVITLKVQYLPPNCTRVEVSILNKRKKKLKYNYLKTVRQDLQQPEVYIDSSKDLCV